MRPLRPSEKRYARMLSVVTPFPLDTTERVVREVGRLARGHLEESLRLNRSPWERVRTR